MQPLVERRELLVHQLGKAVADRPEVGVPAGLLEPVDLCKDGCQLALVHCEQRVPLAPAQPRILVHPGYGLSEYVPLGGERPYPGPYAPGRIPLPVPAPADPSPPPGGPPPGQPPVRHGRGGSGHAGQEQDYFLHQAYHLTQAYFLILASGNPQLAHLWCRLWYELRPHLRQRMWTCFFVKPPIEVVPFTTAHRPPCVP